MSPEKLNACMISFSSQIPAAKTMYFYKYMENADDAEFYKLYSVPLKSTMMSVLFSIFFGSLGVDRFYLGDNGLGLGKLIGSIVAYLTFIFWIVIAWVSMLYVSAIILMGVAKI